MREIFGSIQMVCKNLRFCLPVSVVIMEFQIGLVPYQHQLIYSMHASHSPNRAT